MPQSDDIVISELLPEHARQVAQLHIEGIAPGFISSLGIGFVTALYEAIAKSRFGFGSVAKKNNRVIGFVAFATNLGGLYKSVIRAHGLRFTFSLARKMLSLQTARDILQTLFYPARIRHMNLPSAELLSIVVADEARRKGLATTLIKGGFSECAQRHIRKLKIIASIELKGSNLLYEKLGFERVGQISNHGVISNVYVVGTDHFKRAGAPAGQAKPAPQVRDMTAEDLDDVAAVHKHCFPASVSIFSALDDELVKCFYRQAVEEPESCAAVLESPATGRVVGFAIGTTKDGYRKRLLRRHPFRFAWSIFKGLLTSARIWREVWKRLLGIRKILAEKPRPVDVAADIPPATGPEALFMPIAVHRDYRGGQNAARLAEYLTRQLFDAGAARVRGRIAPDNVASLKFFKRLGWQDKKTCEDWITVWLDRPQLEPKRGLAARAGEHRAAADHPGALITYGWCRPSYAVVWSLGRRGINAHVSSNSGLAMSRFSHYCTSYVQVPVFFSEPEQYVETICKALERTGATVLLPTHEDVGVFSRYRSQLPAGIHIALPDWDSYQVAEDKLAVLDIARQAGCPIPPTTEIHSWDDLENLARSLRWPAVIKTHIGNGAKGVRIAHSREEFIASFKYLVETYRIPEDRWPIVQEFLPGGAAGVCVLYQHGKCAASFAEQYLRCKEPGLFGTSTLRAPLDNPQLISRAISVMDKLKWHGVAHLDFVADKDGDFRLIEVNPRLWGALALSIYSGVDFPYLWYLTAIGQLPDVFLRPPYKPIKCRWIVGDYLAFLDLIKRRMFREALQVLVPQQKCYHDDFVLTDPLPFVFELIDYANKFFKSGGSMNPVVDGMIR